MSEKTVAILKQEVKELESHIRNTVDYIRGIGCIESITFGYIPRLVKIKGTLNMLPLISETMTFEDFKNHNYVFKQDNDETTIIDFTDKNKSKEELVKGWMKLYNSSIDPFFNKFINMYRYLHSELQSMLTTKYKIEELCWWQSHEGNDPVSKIEEVLECLHILLAAAKRKLEFQESQSNNVKRSSDKQKMSPHKIYLHQSETEDCKFFQIIKRKSEELIFLKEGNQNYVILDTLYNADNQKALKKEILYNLDKVDKKGFYTDKDKAGLSTLITRLNDKLLKYFKIDRAIEADELNTSYELKIPILKEYDFES